ncbi:hypothetical protein [Sphingobium cloacae]|uniref:Host cell surface-exposed lipoprotein n=1 Tax=Sphingobium cloacae TaxID=120107 RepID=A0A1E1F338_9SPHN|nr:hypothetical protein [Sphingobium cloacae]BAV64939.1 host cell surface-exposed lipoprotein [Sphingobium cloacae]
MRLHPSFPAAAPFLVLLASCVAPPQQPPAPAPAPPPAPAPEPAPAPAAMEWHDRPVTPGNWTYRPETGGTLAAYGAGGAAPFLSIRCDTASRRISVARPGAAQGTMTIRTSYGAMAWPAQPSTTVTPQTVAIRAASDPALDQIAYSRGKFAVEVAGQPPLILPNWAEVSRVIEDCRG